MEKLDYYDEHMNLLGTEDRDEVHTKGLWHKTIHCWLYDKSGNVYFQIRTGARRLYTTASGHVLAGETIQQAFHREVMEEIGVSVDTNSAHLVEVVAWRMNEIKNGKPFNDRAFANVYINEIDENYTNFKFDENEVLGLVRVNAKECLKLLNREIPKIRGQIINNDNKYKDLKLTLKDFLVQDFEIAIVKYGRILQEIIQVTDKK